MTSPAKLSGGKYAVPVLTLTGILVPLTQYYFRKYDDNGLVSSADIFRSIAPAGFFVILVPCLLLALFAGRISIPSRTRAYALFFACFAGSAFLWTIPEVNIDTSRYFMQAKHVEVYGTKFFLTEWGKAIPAWTDLPVIPFFEGLIFSLLGESRIFVQIFTAVLFAMTAVLTNQIGKTLWDEDTGFYAGAFLLGMPFLLIQTPLMLVDVPTMFFLTLSIHLFLRALETSGVWHMVAAIGAVFLTVFCKYSTWPMLSVLPLIALVLVAKNDREHRRQIMLRSLAIALMSLLLAGTAIALKFDVFSGQIELLKNFQRTGLDRWEETFTSTFLFQVHPFITFAALASLVVAAVKRDLKYAIIAWLPLLIILFHIKRARYTLPVFPMLALMASYGLTLLRNHEVKKIIVGVVIMTTLVTCIFVYRPFLQQTSDINISRAGQFLDDLDIDHVEVFTAPQQNYPINPAIAVPLLDLATSKKIVYHYEPGASTPDEDYHTSRFRFSWEYRNPAYYTDEAGERPVKTAFVLISAKPEDAIPTGMENTIKGLHRTRSFTIANQLYEYQTLVRIYW